MPQCVLVLKGERVGEEEGPAWPAPVGTGWSGPAPAISLPDTTRLLMPRARLDQMAVMLAPSGECLIY
jgi:hypothetical protein